MLYKVLLWPKFITSIFIHCDSATTLAKTYSQVYNGKSWNVGFRHSYMNDLISNGVVTVDFVISNQNLADHLTKELKRDLVNKTSNMMGPSP